MNSVSCQNNELTFYSTFSESATLIDEGVKQIGISKNDTLVWFSFDSIISSPEWQYSEDISWRLSQIQIPEAELKIMPTSILSELCLDYPFFLDYTAVDDYSDGIARLMSTFNGFEELAKREDAQEALVSHINAINISEIVENVKNADKEENQKCNILYVNYVELLLSQIVLSQKGIDLIPAVEQAQQRILHEKLRFPNVFGSYSKEASRLCLEAIKASKQKKTLADFTTNTISTESVSTITLSTTYGRTVTGIIGLDEMTAAEKSSLDKYYRQKYPSATLLSSSTNTYNCHSYAWNVSEGGVTCWINGSNYPQPNLDGTVLSKDDNVSQYWSDGLYASTIERRAEKIYYCRGDHSAIKSSVSGKYESKWGAGPLMRHSPTNCPSIYNADYRTYYKKASMIMVCSVGVRQIYVNETCTYYAEDLPARMYDSYRWEVLDDKNGDNVIGTAATICDESSSSATVTFLKRGIYYVNLYRNHPNRGELVYSLDVYVVPTEYYN